MHKNSYNKTHLKNCHYWLQSHFDHLQIKESLQIIYQGRYQIDFTTLEGLGTNTN